jgi:hypothetical protein
MVNSYSHYAKLRSRPSANSTSVSMSSCPFPPATNNDFPPFAKRTVASYNSFVDGGKDLDFSKATPKYKIETPPFYAAWAAPIPHDSRAGLRINPKARIRLRKCYCLMYFFILLLGTAMAATA